MSADKTPPGPLAGIRILDFTRFQAGPAGSMHLSDLGAQVIKVENTRTGDLGRYYPTPNCPTSSYFQALNRNKRSLAIDYHRPEGREAILRLARMCDVFMENFRPGVVEELKVAYEDLKRENPAIIYAHVTGFGRTGPSAQRACLDLVAQARHGRAGGVLRARGRRDHGSGNGTLRGDGNPGCLHPPAANRGGAGDRGVDDRFGHRASGMGDDDLPDERRGTPQGGAG
jgi:crotonobetainyl-CoA:carnitine CoA-transferase CaiB-like acyl-CoA transferase